MMEDSRSEIKLAGFGGQGIALMGNIIGKATQLYTEFNAVFTQSYGPESRGGASSSDVVIDNKEVDYPYTTKGKVDYFVVMSKEAYSKYIVYLRDGGTIFYDTDLVALDDKSKRAGKVYGIPATNLAEKLGIKIAANIVMLGFFASKTRVIPVEALKKAVLSSVPPRFKQLNEKAFQSGMEYKS
ncbi:MAG: 2-oxoacid:acceptor oxidoreductase family protein [Candidatus Hodarchaeales archaeon]|jgi:2-oxoglutarate ferredoxin oxidoreductase subunit gamma